jgi:Domain of unknown function (DUF4340)
VTQKTSSRRRDSGKRNESLQTLLFIVAALISASMAFYSWPRVTQPRTDEKIGSNLFPELKLSDVKTFTIKEFQAETGRVDEFIVQDSVRGWTIPSKGNYPANAQQQIAQAVNLVSSMRVVDVVPEEELSLTVEGMTAEKRYGCVEPDSSVQFGDTGVGTMVNIGNDAGSTMASFIVGKSPINEPKQRFVRIPKQRQIYLCELDKDILTTNFHDWIEKDLLQIDPFQIAQIKIQDLSVLPSTDPNSSTKFVSVKHRFDGRILFENGAWKLAEFVDYPDGQTATPGTLGDDEELNMAQLDIFRAGLDQLQIADVARKPARSNNDVDMLEDKTFIGNRNNQISLAQRGYHLIPTDDGTPMLISSSGELAVGMNNGVEYILRFGNIAGQEDGSQGKLQRYLMVSARVDESRFPMPVKRTATGTSNDGAPAPDQAEGSNQDPGTTIDPKQQEAIDREFLAQQKDRNDKIETAKKFVKFLNGRFGDWYYTISDDAFQNIHLVKSGLIIKKGSGGTANPTAIPGLDASKTDEQKK